jgi:aspartyl-tRNA(Asn)/glutamyl-tRNA(Gln) amidotransferase subunit A
VGPLSRRAFLRGAALTAAAPALPWRAASDRAWAPSWRFRPDDLQETPLWNLEAWQAADLIRRRTITPLQLAEATLERIEAVEDRIGTFANRYPTREVLEQARAATAEIAAGRYRGPLHGITVGLKDIYLTQGKVTEGNSDLYRGFVPSFDATSVRRLRDAGVVILGKAGTSELATANGWPARNPWDFARAAGGSSTGSATGVAASEFMIGMGTCTGGSIRGPAANCGITGFKPTYGTISLHGIFPLAWSMDHPGPLVRSARDAALVIDAVGGQDPLDPHTRRVARYQLAAELLVEGGSNPLGDVVVGVPAEDDYLMGVPSDDQLAAFAAAVDVLRSLGARVRTVRTRVLFPGLTSTSSFYDIIRSGEVAAYQHQNLRTRPERMSDDYRSRVAAGVLMPGHAYTQAQRVRRLWRDQLLTVFDEVGVLVHPADDVAGLREGEDPPRPRRSTGSKTNLWNLSGAPAVAIPTGLSRAERMPLSMQVAAAPGQDGLALRVADAFQQATDHHRTRPAL